MMIYRLVTIGEEVSLTLRWAETENSQDAIKELIKWARENNHNPALKEKDLTNPECDCVVERFELQNETE